MELRMLSKFQFNFFGLKFSMNFQFSWDGKQEVELKSTEIQRNLFNCNEVFGTR